MVRRKNARGRNAVKGSPIGLREVMLHYEVHNLTEGKSPRTVEWYTEALDQFGRWLEAEGHSTVVQAIDDMTVRRFIVYYQTRPGTKAATMSTHTVYNRVSALRAFFVWLHRQGYTKENVLKDMKQPKTAKLIIEPLNTEEVAAIFRAIKGYIHESDRNAAIVSLMLDTGLRIMEMAGLKEQDVHLTDRYLKVMGKGSKERIIAFGNTTVKALLHYQYAGRPEPANSDVDTYFLARDGYPLTPDAVRSIFKRLSKLSKVRRLHPHLLRHTYATMFLLNGGNVFLLQQNLGHTTLAMVQKYIHFAAQTAAIGSQEFSPLDRLHIRNGRERGANPRHALPEPTQRDSGFQGRNRYRR